MKHLTWVVLGWYLLLPPWVAPYKVNMSAPFSQWKRGASCVFNSFQQCANYKQGMMNALKAGNVKFTTTGGLSQAALSDWNYRVYWNGRCVEVE